MTFPMSNSSTFNLENVLRQNIQNSLYYKTTVEHLASWEEVVDEIYESVSDVEPWMSGNARGPSSAFCLLYRLCTLKIEIRQVKALLDHKDSPYIRAVGFLYLRYVADPKSLWNWCSPYVKDREELTPSPEGQGKKITMGEFVRDLLLEQYYFETIFPRVPKLVMDDIIEKLKAMNLPTTAKGNAGQGGPDRRGVDDGNKRPASVKASLSVAMGQRAPNRSGAREERSNVLANKDISNRSHASTRSPMRPDERARSRSPAATHRLGREREREREGSHLDQPRDRDARGGERARIPDRERERARPDDSSRYDARRDDRRDDRLPDRRDRGRDRSRERGRGGGAREPERADRGARRSRSRSPRDRNGGGVGRDSRDVFRESARHVASRDIDPDRIKERYGA